MVHTFTQDNLYYNKMYHLISSLEGREYIFKLKTSSYLKHFLVHQYYYTPYLSMVGHLHPTHLDQGERPPVLSSEQAVQFYQ